MDPSKFTGHITTAELQDALSTSKLSSSSGPDGNQVIALRIKDFKDDILDYINQLSKMVDSEFNITSHRKHSIIVSIPKKGSSLSIDIQRGITKSHAISKIRNKILLHTIKSVIESKLPGHQSGLRSGRSTTEQIMTLRFLLYAARTKKRSLAIVFYEHCKAIDSVDRRAIQVILRLYGVPDPVVTDVMQLSSWLQCSSLHSYLTYSNI